VRRTPQRAVLTWFTTQPAAQIAPTLAIKNEVIKDPGRANNHHPQKTILYQTTLSLRYSRVQRKRTAMEVGVGSKALDSRGR